MEAAELRRLLALRSAFGSQAGGSGAVLETGDCAPLAMIGDVVPEVCKDGEL